MVNPGHPSRGCYECRRKKVKCDNTRPYCSRCSKARRVCPGFPDVDFKVLVPPTTNTKMTAQSSIRFTGRMDFYPSSTHLTMDYVALHTQSLTSTPDSFFTITRSPSLCLEDLAVPMFFNSFTTSSPSQLGMMTFLPHMYARSDQDSCLRLAMDATAYASAVRQLKVFNNMPLARMKHVAALAAVRNALSYEASAVKNSTLCCLYLLTIFEYISGDTAISNGSHISGYEALLLLRSHRIGREHHWLYQSVVNSVLVKYLRANSVPPPEIVAVLKANLTDEPRSQCTLHGLEVIQLQVQLSQILNAKENDFDLLQLFVLGTRLDRKFQHWPHTDDEAWSFTAVHHSSEYSDGPIHTYSELLSAITWNFHRCVRIILLQTLLRCGQRLLDTPFATTLVLADVVAFQSEILTLIQDIIASYLYILGQFDSKQGGRKGGAALGGYTLIWPIGLILRCPLATAEQKLSTIAALDYIGHVLGLRRALDLKNMWTCSGC